MKQPQKSVRERALQCDPDVAARLRLPTSNEDTLGLHLDVPGFSVVWSPTKWLDEMRAKQKREESLR
jgi:hypothetical protein